ncbi:MULTISPECIES: dipeptidase [Pseudomonas]|uniref:dipeptidase n=1 Tax=Pseudomonas guariconensis TaxID=1288410 RepID=UPI0020974E8E|nr:MULTISPECIES: membrane dipeptidase [Pseudomonas]MCO7597472.1 dipeptidase [Pseudomonas guariconensis]MCU7223214.1 dipeptidase [Pseudomonas brassicacearum]
MKAQEQEKPLPMSSMLVWDNHVCMPLRPHDDSFLDQFQWHHRNGTDVVMVNVGFGDDSIEAHLRMLASLRAWLAARPAQYRLIRSVADIHAARAAGQLAVGFDIEGANAIGDQLNLIELYRDLGVRWMLLAYNQNNRAGGGCQDNDLGLTDFGRAMLEEMARVGMIGCCSHTGYRTAREAIDASPSPLIFSHSNPQALFAHPRNIPDDLIIACAERGGVIGINGIGLFLGDNDASPTNVARHVMYVADLVGVEHVGIGLDFIHDRQEIDAYLAANPDKFPPHLGYSVGMDMMSPAELPALAAQLSAQGMNDAELAAVFGGNWLRLAEQVWRN